MSEGNFLLVIPAFRESERLPTFLTALVETLAAAPYFSSVLVVDDGSGPDEQRQVRELIDSLRQRRNTPLQPPLLLPQNGGKGAAVRAGWAQSHGARWMAFVDADGAINPGEVVRLFEVARQHPGDAIFSSRVKMLGHHVERSHFRHLLGRVFATLVGFSICPEIYDSQCGFKIIPVAAYQTIAPLLRENGFAFDVELLAALLHHKVAIREIAIDWCDQPGSRVHPVRDTWRMAAAVRRIRRAYPPVFKSS